MSQSRSFSLRCTGQVVSLDGLKKYIEELLVINDENLPERTCVQVSTQSVPLCQEDILEAAGRVDLRGFYERLAKHVEYCGRRRAISQSGLPRRNRLVRELLNQSHAALDACTSLMEMLGETGFREGHRERDAIARQEVDTLSSILADTALPYDATPLLLMAALVEGGFSGIIAAMLQGRGIEELTRRGGLFYQVLSLIRSATRLPDLAQLLATTSRHHGKAVSVLGCLTALTPSCQRLLEWDFRGYSTQQQSYSLLAPDTLEKQRKMAVKVKETQELLQAVVVSLSNKSTAAASAGVRPPVEADRLHRIIQDLGATSGTRTAASQPWSYNTLSSNHQETASFPYSNVAKVNNDYSSVTYDSRRYATAASPNGSGLQATREYGVGNGTYGKMSSSARPVMEDMYSISAGGLSLASTGGGGSSNSYSHAAQYTAEALRQQRELQRLMQASAAGHSFVRDGLAHQSQPEGLTSPHDPMLTSTMSYPWGIQTRHHATAATDGQTLNPRQQQEVQDQMQYAHMYKPGTVSGMGPDAVVSANVSAPVHSQVGGYSVPATPQRSSQPPLSSPQQQQQQQLQQELVQQQEQRRQELMQRLEAVSERLQQLSTPTATGRYLGGYTVSDAGAPGSALASPAVRDASQTEGSWARSAARQRILAASPSPAPGISGGGIGWSGDSLLRSSGSILDVASSAAVGTRGGLAYSVAAGGDTRTRQQAWVADTPQDHTAPNPRLQAQQQQYAAARPLGVGYPRPYDDAGTEGAETGGTAAGMAGRQSSVSLVRSSAMDSAAVYASAVSQGSGGQALAAWAVPENDGARAQPQPPWRPQVASTGAAAPTMSASSGTTGRVASVSRDVTRNGAENSPYRFQAISSSSSGSSSGGGGDGNRKSIRQHRHDDADKTRTGKGGTLRAFAAERGLISGVSRSPRQRHEEYTQTPAQAQVPVSQYESQHPDRLQAVSRTSQRASSTTGTVAASPSALERTRSSYDRAQRSDTHVRGSHIGVTSSSFGATTSSGSSASTPRHGAANVMMPAPSAPPLEQPYGMMDVPVPVAQSGRVSSLTTSASANASNAAAAPADTAAMSPGSGHVMTLTGRAAFQAASGSAPGSSTKHISSSSPGHRVGRDSAAGAITAAAWSSSPRALQQQGNIPGFGSSSSPGGRGYGSDAQQQQQQQPPPPGSPYGRTGGGSSTPVPTELSYTSPASPFQAARSSAPSSPSPALPSRPQSGAGGPVAAAMPPVARAEEAEALRSASATGATDTLETMGNLSGRRRMAMQHHSHFPLSSGAGAYDEGDGDGDLQLALHLSRQEAEAAASAAAAAGMQAQLAAAVTNPSRTTAVADSGSAIERSAQSRSGVNEQQLAQPASHPASPPQRQHAGAAVPETSCIDESGGGGMLVGSTVSLDVLQTRYSELNPLLSAKLVSLGDDFPRTRRVAGDGNCFYRAALFAILEHVIAQPDAVLCHQLEAVIESYVRRLESLQDTWLGSAASPVGGRHSRAATPARGRSDGSSGGGGATGGVDPLAVRGGRRLLRLLRTAWFKAVDAVEPSDVSSLEQLFNHSSHSSEVIRFARSLTVHELVSDEAFYAPFIPGCGRDYTGLNLHQICTHHVLPMGVEVEQLQIIALCRALGATLGVLDVAGSHVGAIKHGPAGHLGPPVAWVAHLPGHYDVVYPARPLDVAPGGVLVPVDLM